MAGADNNLQVWLRVTLELWVAAHEFSARVNVRRYVENSVFCLYLLREKGWFTHGGVCTRSNVEYAVTHLQNRHI